MLNHVDPQKNAQNFKCQRRHDLNARIVKGFLGPAAAGSKTSAKVAAAAGPSWQLHRSSISRVSETHGLKRKHHQVMWFDVVIFFGKPYGTMENHGKSLPTLMNRKPSQPVDISLVQHQVTRTCRLIVSIHLRPLDAEQQLLPFATVKMTHWMQLCNTTSQGRTKLLNDAIYITSINMILLKPVWWCGKILKNVKNWTRHSTDQLA